MEKKEILRESIKQIVVEHENKLNNCDDFASIITSQIIAKMETDLPNIMDKIKSSNKKVRVSYASSHTWRTAKPWNKFDKKLDVPRQMLDFDAKNMGSMQEYDKEVSLYELLNESIKNMIVPIMLQNYSFLVDTERLPFAEYCVQRIDDPKFVSQISNLVYAKHLFDSKGELKPKNYVQTNNLENEVVELLQHLYGYETGMVLNRDNWFEARESIKKSMNSTILENDEQFRESVHNTELSMFMIIAKMFNEKRQEMGLPSYSLKFDDITSYSTLLKQVESEITDLKQLSSYNSGRFFHTPFDKNVSGNGFFYDNGEFARIEKKEDSLIEAIKQDIKFKEIHNGTGKVIGGTWGAFNYYGWNNAPIYDAQPFTSKIVSANSSYLQNAKTILADMVISQYAKTQSVMVEPQVENMGENKKRV